MTRPRHAKRTQLCAQEKTSRAFLQPDRGSEGASHRGLLGRPLCAPRLAGTRRAQAFADLRAARTDGDGAQAQTPTKARTR